MEKNSRILDSGLSFLLNYWFTAHEIEYRRDKSEVVENLEASYARDLFKKEDPNGHEVRMIFAGSRIEGMSCSYFERARKKRHKHMQQSDQDIMIVDEGNLVDESGSVEAIKHKIGSQFASQIFCPLTVAPTVPGTLSVFDRSAKGLHPGFYIIKNKESGDVFTSESFHVATIILNKRGVIPSEVAPHGPALSRMDDPLGAMDFDLLSCVSVSHWPLEAVEWIHRHRPNGWPSMQMISKIVQGGCHVVPVGHPQSITQSSEWRLSFSKPEIVLSHSISREQRLVYLAFKTICKYAVFSNDGENRVQLASYFLKTLLFWTIESVEQEVWERDSCIRALNILFGKLLGCLEAHRLPNYFVPENNMIDHVSAENIKLLAAKIAVVKEDILRTIIDIDLKIGIGGKTIVPLPVTKLCSPVVKFICDGCPSNEGLMKAKLNSLARMTIYWYIQAPHPSGSPKLMDLTGEVGIKALRQAATVRVLSRLGDIVCLPSGLSGPKIFSDNFLEFVEMSLYNETILNAVCGHSVNVIPFDSIIFVMCSGGLTKADMIDILYLYKKSIL